MKYKEYNDFELISYVKEQIEEANEILIDKYMPLITKIARTYKNEVGVELKDLIQEGLVGLTKAIKTYSEQSNIIFYTYAKKCIEASIFNLVRSSNRYKHSCLNRAVSIDNDELNMENIITDNINPLTKLLEKEDIDKLYCKALEILSSFEYEVFKLRLENYNYKEIAKILNEDPKRVDNALLRIKNKLIKLYKKTN